MLNRIIFDDDRCLVAVVLQMAEDEAARAHSKEGFDGIDIVIRFDFVLQRSKGHVQRVCLYIADTTTENIADAQSADQLQIVFKCFGDCIPQFF